MALLVQKFGGTSIGSVSRIKEVAKRIATSKEEGNDLVVVVSAMGHTTDELINLASSLSSNPPQREMDMLLATGEQVSIALLSIALNDLGLEAISMTGSQVGIVTESAHGKARILEVKTERIKSLLNQGKIVVVAGFQGTSRSTGGTAEITTLGRGGSDTSAVALATVLGARNCEIYTDVQGVLTTDPRKVSSAKLMSSLSCDEMLELASLGASVLHPRAVELARNYGVNLTVRSSWDKNSGTLLTSTRKRELGLEGLELGKPIDGMELVEKQSVIGLSNIPDKPGVAAELFEMLSSKGVNVDLIIQAIQEKNSNDITFTIDNKDILLTEQLCKTFVKNFGGELRIQNDMSKLSISGAGIMGRPRIIANLFENLSKAGINIRLIATSEVKVSCVIDSKVGGKAFRTVSETFELNEYQTHLNPKINCFGEPEVRGLAHDPKQAQLTLVKVPDIPGTAAILFAKLADKGVSVDAIFQSERQHNDNSRDISFTLKKDDLNCAKNTLMPLLAIWKNSEIVDGPAITRVSAVGAGMPAISGTAGRLFRALANENINILMIATSEIRISCVVNERDGDKALRAIHNTFELGKE